MVEQADAVGDHDHAILVARLDHLIIPQRATALYDIGNTASGCPVDIVAEGKERIAGKAYAPTFSRQERFSSSVIGKTSSERKGRHCSISERR